MDVRADADEGDHSLRSRIERLESELTSARAELSLEAALDRVRNKALTMESSADIGETTLRMFDELKAFLPRILRAGVLVMTPPDDLLSWLAGLDKEGNQVLLEGHPISRGEVPEIAWMLDSWLQGKHLTFLESQDFLRYILEHGYHGDASRIVPIDVPHDQYYSQFNNRTGCVFVAADHPVQEDSEEGRIVARFSSTYDVAYRRYLDLEDAEARAIEHRKQASVDRIRAEIATMRTAEDFERITPLIWKELETQEIPFLRCGLMIISEEEKVARFYLSRPDGQSLAALELPFGSSDVADAIISAWRERAVWSEEWDSDRFISWTSEMMKAGQISRPQEYYGGEAPPESVSLHFIPFEQGMLYVGSPVPLSTDQIDIVQALADAFAVAYARYDDFRTTENALKELRLTQRQLIEQEKLASLGSLTAGIAHEIKNPLNFVNNFAEVSAELAQELSEAVSKGDTDEVKLILDDLIKNATQIAKHGKRADSIVRSMMQHARGGTSERESIDVNEFIEEYVNLAWHGMRARDHGFQAEVIRDYEENLGAIEVQPQEIGRVILNLLNNAFYAVALEASVGEAQLVKVSTRRMNGSVEIVVSDNGPGIKPAVRERIFEPFFTTKPTGEGTGLGLSLSYDIVTKGHGGEMSVSDAPEGGAEFRIVLPS